MQHVFLYILKLIQKIAFQTQFVGLYSNDLIPEFNYKIYSEYFLFIEKYYLNFVTVYIIMFKNVYNVKCL